MTKLPRKGRPPRVVETERGIATSVRGVPYEFKRNEKGTLVPINTRVGTAEDRAYAKRVIERASEA